MFSCLQMIGVTALLDARLILAMKNNNMPSAKRGKNALTDTLDRKHTRPNVRCIYHRVRHNISMIEYWPSYGALAWFEQDTELDWKIDGINVQHIATA